MAAAELGGRAVRASTPGPGVPDRAAGAARPPSGRSGSGALRPGERIPATVEKRGPYMVTRAPSIQAKLRECGRMREGLRRPRPHEEGVQEQPSAAPENPLGDWAGWGRPG
jgi:hypothetical protein